MRDLSLWPILLRVLNGWAGCADVHSPGMDMTLWEAWYCHDGVTVFFGTSEENQDVIMVSLIVHAPPSLVTEVAAQPLHLQKDQPLCTAITPLHIPEQCGKTLPPRSGPALRSMVVLSRVLQGPVGLRVWACAGRCC